MFQAYLITCLANGKVYVGITSRPLKDRWAEHLYESRRGRATMTISRAIAKHGASQFRMEAICSARSWADLCAVENILIAQHSARGPCGYNLRSGGEGSFGHKRTAESIERSAAKHRGKPCHPNTRAAGSRTHLGVPKSAAHRANISAARTGMTHSAETRAKISAARMGKSCNAGTSNHSARLDEPKVREARVRLAAGESQRSIARSFGVHYNAIWKIDNGLTWGWLT